MKFNSDISEQEDIRQYLERMVRRELEENPAHRQELTNLREIETLARWVVSGAKTSLLISGSVGSGKTVLAKALGRTLAVRNSCPYFVAMTRLAALTRKYEEVPAFVYEDRILILDDVGTEPSEVQMYGNRYELFNEIIYARYAAHLPTVMTTNLNGEGIARKYGPRIDSRLKEMCDMLILTGKDLRENNK